MSPVGIGTDVAWNAILEGRSGIGEPTHFDPGDLPITVVGEVPDFDPSVVASPKEARRLDRNVLLAMTAAREAVDDADLSGFDLERIGVLVGSAIGGFITILEQHDIMRERGWARVAPHFFPATLVGHRERGDRADARRPGPELRPVLGLRDRCPRDRGGGRAAAARRRRRGHRRRRRGVPAPAAARRLHDDEGSRHRASRRGCRDGVAAVRSDAERVRVLGGLDDRRARAPRQRGRPRRARARRGDRPRELERRLPRRRTASRVARPDPDDEPGRSRPPASRPRRSATSTRTARRRRRATRPRRSRSRRSSAITPTTSPSPRRSRRPVTSSAQRARSRPRCARSRAATACCRRR